MLGRGDKDCGKSMAIVKKVQEQRAEFEFGESVRQLGLGNFQRN